MRDDLKEKYVNVTLEKDGEIKELSYKFNKLKQQFHAMKDLAKYLRKGWQLQKLSGNSDYVTSMKRLIGDYKTGDPLPIRKMMGEAGLQVLPRFLKHRLQKEEGSNEQESKTKS
jgi:hypothetical protein